MYSLYLVSPSLVTNGYCRVSQLGQCDGKREDDHSHLSANLSDGSEDQKNFFSLIGLESLLSSDLIQISVIPRFKGDPSH